MKLDHSQIGRCFVNAGDPSISPDVYRLTRSVTNHLQLSPYTSLLKVKRPMTSTEVDANWIDVTKAVRKLEALTWKTLCKTNPPTKPVSSLIGRLILKHDEKGRLERELYLVIDYVDGQAFLLGLKKFEAFNWRMTNAVDFSELAWDVLNRANDPDPFKSSIFDSLRGLMKGNTFGNYIKEKVKSWNTPDEQTACMYIFMVIMRNGLPATAYDEILSKLYDSVPSPIRDALSTNKTVCVYKALTEGFLDEKLIRNYQHMYSKSPYTTEEEMLWSAGIALTAKCRLSDVPGKVNEILRTAPKEFLDKVPETAIALEKAFLLVDDFVKGWSTDEPAVVDAMLAPDPAPVATVEDLPKNSEVLITHYSEKEEMEPDNSDKDVVDAEVVQEQADNADAPVIEAEVIEERKVPEYPQDDSHPIYATLKAWDIPEDQYDKYIDRIVEATPHIYKGQRLDLAYFNANTYLSTTVPDTTEDGEEGESDG